MRQRSRSAEAALRSALASELGPRLPPGPFGSRREHRRGTRWFVVVIGLITQAPALGVAVRFGSPVSVTVVLISLVGALALLFLRERPGWTVVAVIALCLPALALSSIPPVAVIPVALAVIGATVRGARAWVWGSLAGLAVVGAVTALLLSNNAVTLVRPLIIAIVMCFLVGIGEALRTRGERYQRFVDDLAGRRQSAVEAERARIARELHDVLAHSLSQISVQAGVGLHLFDTQPEQARDSLLAIRQTSASALTEVRSVLGFLREDDGSAGTAPAPDLARLLELGERSSTPRVQVSIDDAIDPAGVPLAVQAAIFRIAQEAVTNAVRHGHAENVTVRLEREGGELVLTATDDGAGPADGTLPGGGLTGMRERVDLLGGSLQTGAAPGGRGFRVLARVPAPQSSSRASTSRAGVDAPRASGEPEAARASSAPHIVEGDAE